ncbi:PAS domain-containing protein [Puniceicoccales bacterium CK1056]|uniref:histidine kinase n=1 Tax=Oceanipulchritudo coccoides TaxID=2706888 RepID=A0A6B2M2F6_9BACT|nr:PAS domain-containing protein [Oceanipulchritudo coccoides]NDV61900.1 PAS domain-containing protein [Oceanipulchritudo coccoides]
MAEICLCSLPTIQKWRSGEVTPSGAARQLIKLLDFSAKGNPAELRSLLSKMNRSISSGSSQADDEIQQLESSMTKVMNRIELMLDARRKEKALAESEARYRSMVESQEDPVCRWKPDTTLTFVNEAYANLYSKFGTDLLGRKWLDFIPKERRSFIETLVTDMVRRGEPEVLKHESVDKDGQIHYQEWRDIPILDERGSVIEFHSVGRDKTELFKSRQKIEELTASLDSLMQACGNPVILFKPDGTLLQWNTEFKEQLLQDNDWKHLGDLFPALEKKRFNRLLERLTESDHIVYRIKFDNRAMLMTVRAIRAFESEPQFLGVFQEIKNLPSGHIKQVRLAEEILIDDRPLDPVLRKADEKRINREVEAVAKRTQVDRIRVFLFDDKNELANNVIEWCADGDDSHIDQLQRVSYNEYSWWMKKLNKGQWINVSDINQLPGTAGSEKKVLKAQDIASVVVAPLEVDGKLVGSVGFEQILKPRLWHSQEIELLKHLKEKTEEYLAGSLSASESN